MKEKVLQRWGVDPSGLAFSRESFFVAGVTLPADPEPLLRELDRRYYRWIPKLTGDMVAVLPRDGGGRAARVVEIGPTGLVLGAPRIVRSMIGGSRSEGSRIERPVLSGWLVARESGALGQELLPREGGVEVAVVLRDFAPRILAVPGGAFLYDFTQEAIHRRLSRGYLRHDVAPLLRSLSR